MQQDKAGPIFTFGSDLTIDLTIARLQSAISQEQDRESPCLLLTDLHVSLHSAQLLSLTPQASLILHPFPRPPHISVAVAGACSWLFTVLQVTSGPPSCNISQPALCNTAPKIHNVTHSITETGRRVHLECDRARVAADSTVRYRPTGALGPPCVEGDARESQQ
ncbi:hypothetical protein LIA77_02021 [Sarocladium implicatum]|nr:hypothetical protein LIA77_02021 [Sarocladium implicatum]